MKYSSYNFKQQRCLLTIYWFFFYTTDLHKHNTKTISLLNKCTTKPYLIYGDQIREIKKVKKKNPYICIHKWCLQSFLAKVKHLIKKPYILCVMQRETLTNL